jgi:hypothetical protein
VGDGGSIDGGVDRGGQRERRDDVIEGKGRDSKKTAIATNLLRFAACSSHLDLLPSLLSTSLLPSPLAASSDCISLSLSLSLSLTPQRSALFTAISVS